MKLYVCRGTFREPFHRHPCRVAHQALVKAGYEPEVIKAGGLGVGPRFLQWTTGGRRAVEELSGQRVVPILVTDEGEVIVESNRIVRWAEAHARQPQAQRPYGERGGVPLRQIWRQLPKENRRWIVLRAVLATAVFNLVVNAATGWLAVLGQDGVQLWGAPLAETTVFWNLVGTLFLLPLITCALVTTAVRHEVRAGSLKSLSRLRSSHPLLSALPAGRLRRGLALGAIAVAAAAPLLLVAVALWNGIELTTAEFLDVQVLFAVALGTLVTPLIALYAMTDP